MEITGEVTGRVTAPKQRKLGRHVRRYGPMYVVVALVLAVVVWVVVSVVSYVHNKDLSGQDRDKAVAARSIEASALTHGGIVVTGTPSSSGTDNTTYTYDSGAHKLSVSLRLGACNGVDGYFKVPDRPLKTSEVSPLFVVIPGLNSHTADADVPVTASNFDIILHASGLEHCVAGDRRFYTFALGR